MNVKRVLFHLKMELWKDSDFLLLPDSPRERYAPGTKKYSVKWGQLKLFANELLFLTRYWIPRPAVVYAGAAPGIHITTLARMFPEATFYLYDPRRSQASGPNVRVFQQYFTDETAREWSERLDVLFISDIRRGGHEEHEETENEAMIWEDMLAQQRWTEIMRPVRSMLKFRLPYATEQNLREPIRQYLGGLVFLQPFARQSSTETRLVPDTNYSPSQEPGTVGKESWDILKYEQQMFFHNNRVRGFPKYLNPLSGRPDPIDPQFQLGNDYDSVAFTKIVMDYIQFRGKPPTSEMVIPYIRDIIKQLGGTSRMVRQ
jgi:hypothetical protein